jgi:hypothetical protein
MSTLKLPVMRELSLGSSDGIARRPTTRRRTMVIPTMVVAMELFMINDEAAD